MSADARRTVNGKRTRPCVYCGSRTWHRLACALHRDLLKHDPHYNQS